MLTLSHIITAKTKAQQHNLRAGCRRAREFVVQTTTPGLMTTAKSHTGKCLTNSIGDCGD